MSLVTQARNAQAFFDALRAGLLGPTLSQSEVDGCNAILAACAGWSANWTAYALATAYHETWHTMQPVKERGGPAYFRRMYDPEGLHPELARGLGNVRPGDGALFCGRGFVQLTGRDNYARAARLTGLPLETQPDLALQLNTAAAIMSAGMKGGWFTGRKLIDFLTDDGESTRAGYMAARRVINGQDKADLIADYALAFRAALKAAA
jgi:hypothetical protein